MGEMRCQSDYIFCEMIFIVKVLSAMIKLLVSITESEKCIK